MGGGEQSQSEQQPQPSTAAATTTKPMSAEEEFLKRNTDCVYFLASPLTCKKGADCEYRHSDIARVNPRDCWYWLNGNCLNPKCAFRHPPLDGLLETQVQTPLGSSQPPMQTAVMPVASAPQNSGKQAVPCIFFQKGYCLKGHLCPFMHAPNAVNNKVPHVAAATTVSDPPAFKKVFGGLDKCNQEQKVSQENFPTPVELLSHAKPQARVETAGSRKEFVTDRHAPSHLNLNEWPPRYKPTNVPPATNGNSMGRSSRVQQVHASEDRASLNMQQVHGSDDHGALNNKEADEFSRDPSPGFDVLVEDDLRDSDYYQNESNYGGTRDHEGKIQNSLNDYEMVHPDYKSMVDVERDVYREPRDYDSYELMHGQYARDHRRGSSERVLGGSSHQERRRYPRSDSPDRINESDLRHRLSKQKRVSNGLRSVISHDRSRDNYGEDRSSRGPPRRDAHNLPSSEVSVSNRLRGRIKLPGRSSSPVNGTDFHREMDRGRNRARLSPGRSQNSIHQGRLGDRIKGRVQETTNNDDRSFRGLRTRDAINDNNVGFSGPRSLAQLKGGKISENSELQINGQPSSTLGKRKFPPLESQKHAENDISFEGPKPLSEILKRKKSAVTPKEDKEATDFPNLESAPTNEEELTVAAGLEDDAQGGSVSTGEPKSVDDQSRRLERNVSDLETEEGMIVDEEYHDDPETFDQGEEGVYDYEQADGEDYNLEEGENPEGEEYLDEEDDGDDFAKKIGVMFS